jgi:hypothetical protein
MQMQRFHLEGMFVGGRQACPAKARPELGPLPRHLRRGTTNISIRCPGTHFHSWQPMSCVRMIVHDRESEANEKHRSKVPLRLCATVAHHHLSNRPRQRSQTPKTRARPGVACPPRPPPRGGLKASAPPPPPHPRPPGLRLIRPRPRWSWSDYLLPPWIVQRPRRAGCGWESTAAAALPCAAAVEDLENIDVFQTSLFLGGAFGVADITRHT